MNLILTIDIGSPYSSYTVPTIQEYAKKLDTECLVVQEQQLSKDFPQFEKFRIYDLLDKYDRICYLDNDVLVHTDAPNIFESVPEDKLSLFNEGGFMNWSAVIAEAAVRYEFDYSEKDYKGQYYNTGVMVIPKSAKDIFYPPPFEQDVFANCTAFDQPYINLQIRKYKTKIHDLDYRFNRLEYIDRLTGESRFSSYIIHYAGINNTLRMKLIPEDLDKIRSGYKETRRILISMGGGMGDQIAAEPVVRYVKEVQYPDAHIRVISDWPELFKHLDKNSTKRSEFRPDGIYYEMETLPADNKPLWQFLSQAICHTTDFASISCLKTIIPDEFKQIKLSVNERCFNKLHKLIKVPLEELVLVHPGRGWPSKTFSDDWWEEVMSRLLDKDLKVAIIGKHISDEQGYVDHLNMEAFSDVIDLLDLLTTEDLVALISKAQVLISNDSAPVHIAGAFDNNIILIPTCKHPDHVLPYRHGNKYYKASAIYNKLTCDALDSRPTNLNGEAIDKVIGKIEDYLPQPSQVVDKVCEVINEKRNICS